MQRIIVILCAVLVCFLNSVSAQERFSEDLKLLNQYINPIILTSGEKQVIISSEFQGRILTSTAKGLMGASYGWFNKKLLTSGDPFLQKSKLGGEGRIWFGPDQGPFTLFFEIDSLTGEKKHKSPIDLDTISFPILSKTEKSVTLGNRLKIKNMNGFVFAVDVKRKIALLDEVFVNKSLNVELGKNNLDYVAYSTNTTMTNIGKENWSKKSGLMSLWDLGCLHPTPGTTVVIPLKKQMDTATVYFTPIDKTRINIKNKVLYYKADADYLNKIGTLPEYTKPYFGSYSPESNVLTIIKFNFEGDTDYVNAHPVNIENQYRGDVINVFNDGVWNGVGPFGPFYELETSSPAKELKVGESISHYQEIYHFEGSKKELNIISESVLGISINEIERALPN